MSLRDRLRVPNHKRPELDEAIARLKSVGEFFADAVDSVKDSNVAEAVAAAAPWAGAVGGAFAEAAPPIKFLVSLFEKLTEEQDPRTLGMVACTLAYQRAVEQAAAVVPSVQRLRKLPPDARSRLLSADQSLDAEFDHISLSEFVTHPFVARADRVVEEYASLLGYSDAARRQLVLETHRRLPAALKLLLSHGATRSRFAPFTTLLEFGSGDARAYDALAEHADYQRWLFEEAPVLSKEPFALAHIYVDTECGKLPWGDVTGETTDPEQAGIRGRRDPFAEHCGGRHDLMETVLSHLGDPRFTDAVVIQGPAGAGKSAFTLRLCSELVRQGLRPIRIRLRDVRLDVHVSESFPEAVALSDKSREETVLRDIDRRPKPDDIFLGGRIFKETIRFRNATICPYVLILDGWDEISVSTRVGFRARVEKMLEEVRSEFFKNRETPVRVILTGRPSAEVAESNFLRAGTPLLTLRPLRPSQLEALIARLRLALELRPVTVENADSWRMPAPERFTSLLELYAAQFVAATEKGSSRHKSLASRSRGLDGSTLEVLGLPLLAHLALRLIAQWTGETMALVHDSTTLYRSLVDLTCERAGKAPDDDSEIEGQSRVVGTRLRDLLRRTATAMTVIGQEAISRRELSLRLDLDDTELDARATEAAKDSALTALMISFYFKGGHADLGCEFVHKSFREYLFAERIVEILKVYGRANPAALEQRAPYWIEFGQHDPRKGLARELAEALSPQWLSPEVVRHVERLLEWEIIRCSPLSGVGEVLTAGNPTSVENNDDLESDQPTNSGVRAARQTELRSPFRWLSGPRVEWQPASALPTTRGSTPALSLPQWMAVRDALADVWDWWAEGVHLRPQPEWDNRTKSATLGHAYADDLVVRASPLDVPRDLKGVEPARTTTMDAHLGDGIFRLASRVHFLIAAATGWLGVSGTEHRAFGAQLWLGVSESGAGPRRCQSAVVRGDQTYVLFQPAGQAAGFFANYICRINAAGSRPGGPFPLRCDMSGLDLRGVRLNVQSRGLGVGAADAWRFSNIEGVNASGSSLSACDFSGCMADEATFRLSLLNHSTFRAASLVEANFYDARVSWVDFSDADLRSVQFVPSSAALPRKRVSLITEIVASVYERLKEDTGRDDSADGMIALTAAIVQRQLASLRTVRASNKRLPVSVFVPRQGHEPATIPAVDANRTAPSQRPAD
jgi:hypothetical protein